MVFTEFFKDDQYFCHFSKTLDSARSVRKIKGFRKIANMMGDMKAYLVKGAIALPKNDPNMMIFP